MSAHAVALQVINNMTDSCQDSIGFAPYPEHYLWIPSSVMMMLEQIVIAITKKHSSLRRNTDSKSPPWKMIVEQVLVAMKKRHSTEHELKEAALNNDCQASRARHEEEAQQQLTQSTNSKTPP